jgi:integrase
VQQLKRVLAHTKGAERVFFWLAAETGLRAGELIALRVSEVEKLAVEVSKAILERFRRQPKTETAFRSICISSRLGSQLKEYLADRVDGYLFQTSSGNPRDASNVLERKPNTLVERLEIPKKLACRILASSVFCELGQLSGNRPFGGEKEGLPWSEQPCI